MNKILTFTFALLLSMTKAQAQGIAAELYQYNYSLIHPAFAGSNGQKISMLTNTITYNASFGNGVNTLALLSYENYLDKINSGIAVTGYSERLGSSSVTSIGLSYNYSFKFGKDLKLVMGTKVRRHIYSVNLDYYEPINPNDPLIGQRQDVSEANWVADLGLLLNVKKFNFGLAVNNLLHTNEKIDLLVSNYQFDKVYTAIIGTSFKFNDHLISDHSLYCPLEGEFYRIDLNNTLTVNNFFVAGISIESTKNDFFTRFNTGIKIKDYLQIAFLVYSEKRNDFFEPKFRGEIYMDFKF